MECRREPERIQRSRIGKRLSPSKGVISGVTPPSAQESKL